jgi:acetyltransferase
VDIIGDADAGRYVQAFRILAAAQDVDAILVMHVPTAIVQSEEVADATVEEIQKTDRPVLVSWLGEAAVANAREIFHRAGIPSYESPVKAIRALLHMVNYRRNQELLMETPPSIPEQFLPATQAARWIIEAALTAGRDLLTEPEAKAVLSAYGLPVVETRTVTDEEEALIAAGDLGYPVALKLLSRQISHKSDVGGVALNIEDDDDLLARARAIRRRVAALRPEATIDGFTVQQMARRPGAHELIVGMTTDPIFGPVLLFGQGGTAVELIADKAVALPPLNIHLTRELMGRTRVFRLLQGYRDHPPADLSAVEMSLIKVSQLIIDLPEIVDLDINPLLADWQGVLALDARLRVQRTDAKGRTRLAIRPYPKELEETVFLNTGRKVLLRPIRPEDEPAHLAFLDRLAPQDLYFRFFSAVNKFDHARLARFTQIDYDREMAFIATAPGEHGAPETLGVVRTVCDADNISAEFAVVVRTDLKGQGLGRLLLDKIIQYCRARGTLCIVGEVLRENTVMLELAKRAGFREEFRAGTGTVSLRLELQSTSSAQRAGECS